MATQHENANVNKVSFHKQTGLNNKVVTERRAVLGEIKNQLNAKKPVTTISAKGIVQIPAKKCNEEIKKTTSLLVHGDKKKKNSVVNQKEVTRVRENQNYVNTNKEKKIITKGKTDVKSNENALKQIEKTSKEDEDQRVSDNHSICKKTVAPFVSFSSQNLGLIDDTEDDPLLVSEYINDIMFYLYDLESKYVLDESFLLGSKTTPRMRATLVNWLVDVHLNFRMLPETLHLCVAIVDRYLQKNKSVGRSNLQLVGITALFVASKYEELYSPDINDLVYMCDNAFSRQKIIHMELSIIHTLDYSFGRPLSLHFLRRYSKIAKVNANEHTLSKYFIELALLEHELSFIRPSLQAAAATCLSVSVLNEVTDPCTVWSKTLIHYTSYSFNILKPVLKLLATAVVKSDISRQQAIRKKYSLEKFSKLSNWPELKCSLVQKLARTE